MSQTPFGARTVEVLEVRELGAYALLSVEDAGPVPEPGQFAMLAAAEHWGGGSDERPFLPRAISVCSAAEGRIDYLLEAVGPGTGILCSLRPGDAVRSLGPLGRGFSEPPAGERAVLVGGGIGAAPLVELERRLGQADVLLGFRDGARAQAAVLFSNARVATDDGSVGEQVDHARLLERELAAGAPARVYACGPAAMLEAVRLLCEETQTPSELALESPMACGYGACWGCVVPLRDGTYARVCLDGPVFEGHTLERVGEHFGSRP